MISSDAHLDGRLPASRASEPQGMGMKTPGRLKGFRGLGFDAGKTTTRWHYPLMKPP